MSRNCGVQRQSVLARDPLAIEPHRLGNERRRRAELGERGPVAGDLERRGEPGVPRVGDVGRADEPRVVGEQDGEPRLGDDGLAGRRQVQAEAPVEGGVDRQQRDVAGGVDLVDHHDPPLAHRLHERRVDECDLAPAPRDRDVVVAEEELVRRGAGLELDEPVERDAVPLGDLAAATRPEAVGDRAGDLALARAGRADQPQEASRRPGRPCRAARGRARRPARRAASAGRSACRPEARSARQRSRARVGCLPRERGPRRRPPGRSATGQR